VNRPYLELTKGLRREPCERWARNEFLGSLANLTVLLAMLLIDRAPAF